MSQEEFSHIISGCKNGDRDAQTELYRRFSSVLFSICLRYCTNRAEAEDALQESYIRIFRNIQQYKSKGSFEGWLKRVTVNTTLSILRKKNVLKENANEDAATRIQDTSYSDNLELESLLKMINQLPPQKKVVFNLYEVEGYSHKEIGEMLGITDSTSRSLLTKAKSMLKEMHIKANQVGKKVS